MLVNMGITTVVVCIVMLTVGISSMTEGCPNILSRGDWNARSARSSPLTVNPPTHVVIHHSEGPSCTTQETCIKRIQSIQNDHINNRKWSDIGYNFLVGEDGNVYEGRGWGKMGAHAPNYNSKSIGICIIGNYVSNLPNAQTLQAVKDLISCGVSQGKIKQDYRLVGHRQVRATDCPGDKLYTEITSWPNWTSTP